MTNSTNIKKYDIYDIFIIFFLISQTPNISRKNICDLIEIGEGSIKSILNILEDKNLIIKSQSGNCLSKKGELFLDQINSQIFQFNKINYDIFNDNLSTFGIIINNYDNWKIKHIYFARDYAIRTGCWSAMILKYDGQHIKLNNDDTYNFDKLKEIFELQKNDLLILTSSNQFRIAIKGIIEVAKYLNEDFSNLIRILE